MRKYLNKRRLWKAITIQKEWLFCVFMFIVRAAEMKCSIVFVDLKVGRWYISHKYISITLHILWLCVVVGVEGVEIDAVNQKVIVKGEKADPIKVAERLRKRSGKHVEVVHPQPAQAEEKKKVEVKATENYYFKFLFDEKWKPWLCCFWCFGQPPKVLEVVLKIKIHCEGCAKEVKHCIHNMEGMYENEMQRILISRKLISAMDCRSWDS